MHYACLDGKQGILASRTRTEAIKKFIKIMHLCRVVPRFSFTRTRLTLATSKKTPKRGNGKEPRNASQSNNLDLQLPTRLLIAPKFTDREIARYKHI